MFYSFKLSRVVALLTATLLLMIIMLCSCNADSGSGSGSGEQSGSQGTEVYSIAKYEFEGISVDSMGAVVGKDCVGVISEGGAMNNLYIYEDLSDSNIRDYGDYLLQSGFEEVQENVFSTTNPNGATMKITIDGNDVSVQGK